MVLWINSYETPDCHAIVNKGCHGSAEHRPSPAHPNINSAGGRLLARLYSEKESCFVVTPRCGTCGFETFSRLYPWWEHQFVRGCMSCKCSTSIGPSALHSPGQLGHGCWIGSVIDIRFPCRSDLWLQRWCWSLMLIIDADRWCWSLMLMPIIDADRWCWCWSLIFMLIDHGNTDCWCWWWCVNADADRRYSLLILMLIIDAKADHWCWFWSSIADADADRWCWYWSLYWYWCWSLILNTDADHWC